MLEVQLYNYNYSRPTIFIKKFCYNCFIIAWNFKGVTSHLYMSLLSQLPLPEIQCLPTRDSSHYTHSQVFEN